jgi:hypothetical protein
MILFFTVGKRERSIDGIIIENKPLFLNLIDPSEMLSIRL